MSSLPLPLHEDDCVISLNGYEGPLDLLLSLAQKQKVDLLQVSVLELVNQYLEYIRTAQALRLEVAADYLVMASWLAYLKSRLLLPEKPTEEGDPEDDAEALASRLRLLEHTRHLADWLEQRPQLGRDVFARAPQREVLDIPDTAPVTYRATLRHLLQAYTDIRRTTAQDLPQLDVPQTMSVDMAIKRLETRWGDRTDWLTFDKIAQMAPDEDDHGPLWQRSVITASFGALLDLARRARVTLKQDSAFSQISFRFEHP